MGGYLVHPRCFPPTGWPKSAHFRNSKYDPTPSERVAIAEALRGEIGERRGRPTTEIPQNFGEFTGRHKQETAHVVAEKAGFGNAETYRQAKTVQIYPPSLPCLLDARRSAANSRRFGNV